MIRFFCNKSTSLLFLAFYSLCLLPIVWALNHVDLTSAVSDPFGLFIKGLTNSAGSKGFLISLVVLCLLVLRLKLERARLVKLILQFGILLVLSFGAKTILKHITAIPRPFTEFLAQQHNVPTASDFYALSEQEKVQHIDTITNRVSTWRTDHWQGEMNYSFPSGHTIFASVCILFFGGLFLQQGKRGLAGLLLIWALGIGFSRLWLGMHHPSDLYGSIASAAILYLLIPTQQIDKIVNRYNGLLHKKS